MLSNLAQSIGKDKERGDTGMQLSLTRRVSIVSAIVLAMQVLAIPPKAHGAATGVSLCTVRPLLCPETAEHWNSARQYTVHDEPSLLFYSFRSVAFTRTSRFPCHALKSHFHSSTASPHRLQGSMWTHLPVPRSSLTLLLLGLSRFYADLLPTGDPRRNAISVFMQNRNFFHA